MHSRSQLKEAIAQRDVEALEKAIAAAVEVRLQDPLVAQAQQLYAQGGQMSARPDMQGNMPSARSSCCGSVLGIIEP